SRVKPGGWRRRGERMANPRKRYLDRSNELAIVYSGETQFDGFVLELPRIADRPRTARTGRPDPGAGAGSRAAVAGRRRSASPPGNAGPRTRPRWPGGGR